MHWLGSVPEAIDRNTPSAARVYDYYLGGSNNFAVDRKMGDEAIAMWPDLPMIMRENRAFLRRAVQYCLSQGIRQFLDLGSGIPTAGNVHEIAQQAEAGTRVVYVDNDPVAVAHSRRVLQHNPATTVVEADLRAPAEVLSAAEVASMLDLTQPVAVMMVAVLHFVVDSDAPPAIVREYRDAVAPGSLLAISHATHEGQPGQAAPHQELYRQRTATPMTMRSRNEVQSLFDGFDLVDPGVVYLPQWRPDAHEAVDEHPERFSGLAGVGRRR